MKKASIFCLLLALALSLNVSIVWAVDVGWMQKGVRLWYFGAAGTTMSSDAEEAYLIASISGNNVQVTKHSGLNHWGSPNPPDTGTHPFLDKGPFWMHPQKLQTLQSGETWKGQVIATVLRETHTYESFKAQFSFPYLLLPIKALFDLSPQRNLVKIVYYISGFSTGIAYFDADTGLLLLYETSSGYVTIFFILSEINYNFATHRAFAEDDGPHTGFKSEAIETSTSGGAHYVMVQSSVESRYGSIVQMWVSTSENSNSPPYENYCFFGGVPVLRRINMTQASNYPPEQWNAYGQYLWWWVPPAVLQNSSINVFGVTLNRTSTNPYTFTAAQEPTGFFYYSKLIFDANGYLTAFAAKDSTTGLNIAPGQSNFTNLTTVKGLDYYRNTMGTPTLADANSILDLNGDGKVDFLWRYNPSGALAYWLMDGVTITAGGGITTLSTDWQLTGTPDLNGDGKADLLWRHTPTGTIAYWIMSGATIASTGTLGSVPSDWRIAGMADFNADGMPDILWQHTPTGTVAVWYMNGTSMTSSAAITAVGTDWQIAGTPDLNADGKPDILWRQASTGLVAYWLMDGITIQAGGGIATVPSNWHIVGTPDLNADGKADILWHDTNTGTVSYWYMNGTSIAGGGAITTVPTDWDIIAPR
jgi:hypothetical protein